MASPGDKDSAVLTGGEKRAHHLVERGKVALELGGVGVPGVDTLLVLWRKFGLKRLFWVVLLVGVPVSDYSLLRWAVYSGIPRTVGNLGVAFEAEEWSLKPLSLTAVAYNVKVRAPHDEAPVFTAGEMKFTGSIWTFLRGLPDMVTFHLFGGDQPFNEIEVKHGELRVERSPAGGINLQEALASVPLERQQDALDGVYQVQALKLDDVRVTYVEHLSAGASDGIFRTAQAEVYVDQIQGTIVDLVRPKDDDERPTRINLQARSASGTIHIQGDAAIFRPRKQDSNERQNGGAPLRVGNRAADADGPLFDLTVALANVGAAAYGKMVPVTTIVPTEGSINGTTKVKRRVRALDCEGYFTVSNVKFGPNPAVFTDPASFEIVKRGLATVPSDGQFDICGRTPGDGLRASADAAPATGLLASFNAQATANASPAVRALVSRDQRALAGQPVEMSLDQVTKGIADQLGGRLARSLGNGVAGKIAGGALSESLTGQRPAQNQADSSGSNPLAKGVKGVGSGIKKLFGGGKDNSKRK
jgi:hypothetical protein